MFFYIVTPTYHALPWLQRCVRSVADQVGEGIVVHHHVQDGGSSDGTPAWLAAWQAENVGREGYVFTYESARDGGMYDAINKSWDRMPLSADVTAHLNSDEQYLPGALGSIASAFLRRPEVDIALGTYVVVDAESRYICHRRPVSPRVWSSKTVCEVITCSCFHRAKAFLHRGIRFDTSYRALADVVFYRKIVESRAVFLSLPRMVTSVFTVTGENLAWTETSRSEWSAYLQTLPSWVARRHALAYRVVNLRRRWVDAFCPPPREYALYLPGATARAAVRIKRPTCHWGCRVRGED